MTAFEKEPANDSASAELDAVAALLRAEDFILIVSHQRPDGDCLGSATALLAGLKTLGKTVAAYNVSGVPRILRFLPNANEISTTLPAWTPRVTVFVDCGNASRVAQDFAPSGTVINIDHHATNDRFGDLNYIDTHASAVGEQILHLLNRVGVEITPAIATSLYTSLAADTGSFRYSTTNAGTFEIARQLAERGAKPWEVCQHLFESKTPQEVILAGRCFSRLTFECNGRFVWSELRWQDYVDVGGPQHEPEGLSTDIRGIDGVEISILFQESSEGALRASFRSKGLVNCAKLAESFGGGGHPAAAGYTSPKDVDFVEHRNAIVAATIAAVCELNGETTGARKARRENGEG